MVSRRRYPLLIGLSGLVAAERVAELVVSRRHEAWARRHGGREYGRRHYPVIVLAHAGLLVAAPLEVWLLRRPYRPALGRSMLAVVLLAQGLRWWCVASLGRRWTTRVIVVPGLPLVERGPYRWLRHPNYVAVTAEGIALPLVHGAGLTAIGFGLVNAALLAVRIRVENRALGRPGK